MKILGMDQVDLIIPICLITGVVYILLVINYFIRFIWAKSYLKYMTGRVIDIYKNHILPIFDHSKAVQLDNGFYFINQKVQDYFPE